MENSLSAPVLVSIGLLIWLLPVFFVVFSRKTYGSEKVTWIMIMILTSWIALIFYLILAPINRRY